MSMYEKASGLFRLTVISALFSIAIHEARADIEVITSDLSTDTHLVRIDNNGAIVSSRSLGFPIPQFQRSIPDTSPNGDTYLTVFHPSQGQSLARIDPSGVMTVAPNQLTSQITKFAIDATGRVFGIDGTGGNNDLYLINPSTGLVQSITQLNTNGDLLDVAFDGSAQGIASGTTTIWFQTLSSVIGTGTSWFKQPIPLNLQPGTTPGQPSTLLFNDHQFILSNSNSFRRGPGLGLLLYAGLSASLPDGVSAVFHEYNNPFGSIIIDVPSFGGTIPSSQIFKAHELEFLPASNPPKFTHWLIFKDSISRDATVVKKDYALNSTTGTVSLAGSTVFRYPSSQGTLLNTEEVFHVRKR